MRQYTCSIQSSDPYVLPSGKIFRPHRDPTPLLWAVLYFPASAGDPQRMAYSKTQQGAVQYIPDVFKIVYVGNPLLWRRSHNAVCVY